MIVAIDIGGTKIAIGFVDEAGTVVGKISIPTNANLGPEHAAERITTQIKNFSAEHDARITGIGIGCTGPVYPQLGTIGRLDFLPGWEGFNLVQALEKELGVKAYLENDADAAALGEWAWGVGKGKNPFVLVTVGTGIGVGVILDGKLYRGVNGAHPEIGHHFIDPGGPPCSCGGNGCWESLASGPAMEKWAMGYHPQGTRLSARELCHLAETGDELALGAVERTAHYLGVGIANLVTIFTPKMIALTGGLMTSQHLFMPVIQETVKTMCGYVPADQVEIVAIPPDADAGLRGAAQVWVFRHI